MSETPQARPESAPHEDEGLQAFVAAAAEMNESEALEGRDADGTIATGIAIADPPHGGAPAASRSPAMLRAPELYLNRELTWLQFNFRVLNEARDRRTPLLERVKFLAIAASNMDEFFMKRIGGLKQQIGAGVHRLTVDGRVPPPTAGCVSGTEQGPETAEDPHRVVHRTSGRRPGDDPCPLS
jgi:hypothetical protein